MAATTTCADSSLAIAADVCTFITFALAFFGYVIAYIVLVHHSAKEVGKIKIEAEFVSMQISQWATFNEEMDPSEDIKNFNITDATGNTVFNGNDIYQLLKRHHDQTCQELKSQQVQANNFIARLDRLQKELERSKCKSIFYTVTTRPDLLVAANDLLVVAQRRQLFDTFRLLLYLLFPCNSRSNIETKICLGK